MSYTFLKKCATTTSFPYGLHFSLEMLNSHFFPIQVALFSSNLQLRFLSHMGCTFLKKLVFSCVSVVLVCMDRLNEYNSVIEVIFWIFNVGIACFFEASSF
jgi:hypothetical protein